MEKHMESTTTNNDTTRNEIVKQDDWSLAVFLDSPRSQFPEFLVHSLTPECSLTMLAAEPGAGKSIFAAALGLAVAQGQPFLDLRTKKGGVLFIGEDAPAWDYGSILRKLLNSVAPPE